MDSKDVELVEYAFNFFLLSLLFIDNTKGSRGSYKHSA